MMEEQIVELLKDQQKMLHKHEKILKTIRRQNRITHWLGFLKILIILAPIVLAFIFVPKYIDQLKQDFGLNEDGSFNPTALGLPAGIPQGFDMNELKNLLQN